VPRDPNANRHVSTASVAELNGNPPCFECGERRNQHPNDKCLFAATTFQMPSDDELIYYTVYGYFKGRHA